MLAYEWNFMDVCQVLIEGLLAVQRHAKHTLSEKKKDKKKKKILFLFYAWL